MAIDYAAFTIKGKSGKAIRKQWLWIFCICIAYSCVWMATSPFFNEQIASGKISNIVSTLLFCGLLYLFGYLRHGTKLLWAYQALSLLSLLFIAYALPAKWYQFVDSSTMIWGVGGCIMTLFYLIWSQRLISLNRAIQKATPK